ncbi:MAG: holo-ACP synthase [Nitrosomonas sp.]|nr:holo-ACP synthase [Nitrosomonas sp.]
MIYGIGTDIVEPSRIARSLKRYGDRFAKRILADAEWLDYQNSTKQERFVANRFAAKEAFSKAMGTGLRYPVALNYIEVAHDALGKPYFKFHAELKQMIKNEGVINHHLSISDEINLVCAFVVLEK